MKPQACRPSTPQERWRALYRFARATRDVNPLLAEDVLAGHCRWHAHLAGIFRPYYAPARLSQEQRFFIIGLAAWYGKPCLHRSSD